MKTAAVLDIPDLSDAAASLDPPRAFRQRAGQWLRSPTIRKGGLSVIDQAVVSGTSFLSSVLVGRMCSKEDLGVYALGLSVLLLARGIQGETVSAPYMVYCHRRRDRDLASYTGSTLVHQAIVTLLTMVALIVLSGVVAWREAAAGLQPVLFGLVLVAPFILLREYLRRLALARLRVGAALLLDVVVSMVQLTWLAVLAWQGRLTVPAVYTAMAVGCLLASAGWFAGRRMPMKINLSAAWDDWVTNWSFGRWSLSSHLVSRAMTYLAPWLIAFTHGEAATGVMAACVTVVNILGTFVTGVTNFLTPRAARAYTHEGVPALKTVLLATLGVYLATVGSFCLFLAVTDDLLVTLIYGTRYAGTGAVLLILALHLLVNTVGITAGTGLWALDRPQVNFLGDLATLIVTGAVMIGFVPEHGVIGAAWAMLLGTLLGTVVRIAVLVHEMKLAQSNQPVVT